MTEEQSHINSKRTTTLTYSTLINTDVQISSRSRHKSKHTHCINTKTDTHMTHMNVNTQQVIEVCIRLQQLIVAAQ